MQATKRVTVPLTEAECNALRTLADAEMRDPREQARWLIRQALMSSGEIIQSQLMHNRTGEISPEFTTDAVAV